MALNLMRIAMKSSSVHMLPALSKILNVGTGDPHSDAFERAIALGKKATLL